MAVSKSFMSQFSQFEGMTTGYFSVSGEKKKSHRFPSKFVAPTVAPHKPRLTGEGCGELIEPRVFIGADSRPAIRGSLFRVKVLSLGGRTELL